MQKTEAIFVCRNVSMGLCECETGDWQVLQDGMWNAVKSPYGSKYVDVKLADKKSTAFSLSIQEGKDIFPEMILSCRSHILSKSICICLFLSNNLLSFRVI
jgi:hypothetical protein